MRSKAATKKIPKGVYPTWPDVMWVTLRVLLAGVGGYFFAMATASGSADLLGLVEDDRRRYINMMFFLFYTAYVMWVFAIQSHRRALLQCGVALAVIWAAFRLLGGAQ